VIVESDSVTPHFEFVHKDGSPFMMEYATDYSAGFELRASATTKLGEGVTIIPTNLFISKSFVRITTDGFLVVPELQVRDKSGRTLKTSLRVANSPGTVDCDFIDFEVGVMLEKRDYGAEKSEVVEGEAVAQGVVCLVVRSRPETSITRQGGFGSTGVK
jgi:dUTP pyrophosphatase